MTTTVITCDLCKEALPANSKKVSIQVVFTTEQTEGRSTEPYLCLESIDCCKTCLNRIIDSHPLWASGAQGYNTYTWRPKLSS